MATTLVSKEDWIPFFESAGFSPLEVDHFASIFFEHKIRESLLPKLTIDLLQAMGIGAIGDRMMILERCQAGLGAENEDSPPATAAAVFMREDRAATFGSAPSAADPATVVVKADVIQACDSTQPEVPPPEALVLVKAEPIDDESPIVQAVQLSAGAGLRTGNTVGTQSSSSSATTRPQSVGAKQKLSSSGSSGRAPTAALKLKAINVTSVMNALMNPPRNVPSSAAANAAASQMVQPVCTPFAGPVSIRHDPASHTASRKQPATNSLGPTDLWSDEKMVALSDLNDDCLTAVLSYLTFVQLFACISSLQLKNNAFYRCALVALKRSYAPFSLEPTFHRKRWRMWLTDVRTARVLKLKVPRKFVKSALASSVEHAEIPIYCNYAWDDLDVWLNLVKALPSLMSLSIRVLRNPGCTSSYVSSNFDKLTSSLVARLANLSSFAVVGIVILPEPGMNAVIEMISRMPAVVSLKMPTYLLNLFLARLPAKANALRELFLYRNRNYDYSTTVACTDVFATISNAGLAELTHLKYTCRHDYFGVGMPFDVAGWGSGDHECVQSFAPLQELPKLDTLTLDVDFGPLGYVALPRQTCKADLVSLSALNVTLRCSNLFGRAVWTHSLLRQFINLRAVDIVARHPDNSLVELIGSAFSHTSPTLRDLTVETIEKTPSWMPPHLPPLLPTDLHDFRQLEHIIVSGSEIDLRGFVSEERAINSNGYPSIAELINRLKKCDSLKYVKIRASVDSPEALKAWLPDNCEIVGVVERPCEDLKTCFVLHPDKYWRPVEILISADKDAVSLINETAKFALCLNVPH